MVIPGGLLSRESVKLLDFGIAKLGHRADRPPSQKLTQHGLVLGTPGYMSPEQAVGQEADVRSDVYSCGVILYQMLTGHRPFEGEATFDVLLMHLNTQPKSLREVADGAWIPDAVESVVLRALAKRPAQRYQSAGELRQALEQAVVVDYGQTGAGETARVPGRLSAGSRFLCLAIIGAAATTLLGDHLRSRRASAANSAAVAGAAAPAPAPRRREADRARDRTTVTRAGQGQASQRETRPRGIEARRRAQPVNAPRRRRVCDYCFFRNSRNRALRARAASPRTRTRPRPRLARRRARRRGRGRGPRSPAAMRGNV